MTETKEVTALARLRRDEDKFGATAVRRRRMKFNAGGVVALLALATIFIALFSLFTVPQTSHALIRHHGEHFCTSGRRSHGAGPCAPTRPPTKAATPNVLMLSRLIPIGSTPENPTPVEAMAWRLRTPEGKQLYGPRPVRHTLRTARAAAPALLETGPVLIHPRHLQWRPSSASAVPRSSTPGVTSTCAATAIISR
jgi:hypothetical protein